MKLQNLVLAVALFALAVPLPALGNFIPPNLPAGSKYEIAFVTSAGTTATDPYILDYDAFVTAQAQENPNLPQGVTWHAIASTYENGDVQDAIQNALFTPSIPVYNSLGQLVADSATSLYSEFGNIINPINGDQFGDTFDGYVWTGSGYDGTPDNPLGNPLLGYYDNGFPDYVYGPPDVGYTGIASEDWLGQYGYETETDVYPLYALSSPITVPEPSTVALLLTGLLAGAAFARRKSPPDNAGEKRDNVSARSGNACAALRRQRAERRMDVDRETD